MDSEDEALVALPLGDASVDVTARTGFLPDPAVPADFDTMASEQIRTEFEDGT